MNGLLRLTSAALAMAAFTAAARGEGTSLIPRQDHTMAALVHGTKAAETHKPGVTPQQEAAYRAWKISLIPLVASQVLDTASSYGMRELNPLLAGSDGRFGGKAAGIKLGATAAIAGLEYWIVKKHPGSAKVFSKLNWSGAVVTSSFAVHNYAIR